MYIRIEENVNFEKQEIKLEKEDVIFVYTDGVTEASNEENYMELLN